MKRFLHIFAAAFALVSTPIAAQTAINGRQVTVDGVRLDSALASKAAASDVTAALAVKANATDVTTSLAAKADTTAVTTAIDAVKTLGEVTFGRTAAPNSDLTNEMQIACSSAGAQGFTLRLPPIRFYDAKTCAVAKMVGTPNKTVVVLAGSFTKTGFANQFAFLNPGFSQGYNAGKAPDDVLYRDFDIEVETQGPISVLGFANVSSGLVSNVNIRARPIMVNGVPAIRDTLIDLYAAVKNFRVEKSQLENTTGAHGAASNLAAGGGSCMWIRNLSSDGTLVQNITENIEVTGNICRHYTSDEALAIYGVRGPTWRVSVHHNFFYGLLNTAGDNSAAPGGVYHPTFISIFPLNDGSGAKLGVTAAVYDSSFTDNYIEDRSFLYSVVRLGNTPDASNRFENVTTARNKIGAFQSNNASTGAVAAWVAAGSPTGLSPTAASIVLRNIDGTSGTAYNGTFSGNTSSDDVVYTLAGAQETINTGFSGFPAVFNPTTRGSIFTGIASVGQVSGGLIEASGRAFFNSSVTGARYRVTLSTGFAFTVSNGLQFTITGTNGTSTGGFISITSGAGAATRVLASSNIGTASTGYAVNNAVSGATVVARMNDIAWAPSGIATGPGTYTGSLNRWGAAVD